MLRKCTAADVALLPKAMMCARVAVLAASGVNCDIFSDLGK
jgi:hypothetical protein